MDFTIETSFAFLRRQVRHPSALVTACAVVLVASILLVNLLEIQGRYRRALVDAERDIQRINLLLSEITSRTMGGIDLVLRHASAQVVKEGPAYARAEAAFDMLRAGIGTMPAVHRLSLYDQSGALVNISQYYPPPAASIADRSCFTKHRDNAQLDLQVSEPMPACFDGVAAFALSRRIQDSAGVFLGVIVAWIDPSFFEKLYRSLDLPEGTTVALLRDDFVLLARHPWRQELIGRPLGAAPIYRTIFSGQADRGYGHFTGLVDGLPRVAAARRLFGLPFVVCLSIPQATILATWQGDVLAHGLGGLIASLIVAGAALLLTRQISRREDSLAALGRSHQALVASEERVRLVLEASSDGIWDWSVNDGWSNWSPRLYDLLGLQPTDNGMPIEQAMAFMHPEDGERVRAAVRNHFTTGQPFRCEFRFCHADGHDVWVYARGRALRDGAGRPYRMVGSITDITERKALELAVSTAAREVQDAALRAKGILTSMVDGVLVCDESGTILEFNPAAEALFGYLGGEAVGQPIGLLMPEPFRSEHQRFISNVLVVDSTLPVARAREVVAQRKDGTLMPVELSVSQVVLEARDNGAPAPRRLFVGTVRDITERRRWEEALLTAKAQAEVANQTRSAFLAHMSHELRTPLNAIIGFADVIAGAMIGPLGDRRYRQYGRDIVASAQHLLGMIEDLLNMSRLEGGLQPLQDTVVAPSELVRVCFSITRAAAAAGGITLQAQVPDTLPLLRIDLATIKLVLAKVLANAVKFSPRGSTVVVSAWLEDTGRLAIAVVDSGCGIPPDLHQAIFQPFRHRNSMLARPDEGAGFGLPLARSYMELHGGTIAVTSTPGRGTTMTLRFPADRVVAG